MYKEGIARIDLLDFQDGLIGTTAYDFVSLAQRCTTVYSTNARSKNSLCLLQCTP